MQEVSSSSGIEGEDFRVQLEGRNFEQTIKLADEVAEGIAAVIRAGDEAQSSGYYRGFTLAGLLPEDVEASVSYETECKLSSYKKGQEVRLFLEGLHRGLYEGFHGWEDSTEGIAIGVGMTFRRGYRLGFELGRAGRAQEIEKTGRIVDRNFQQFIRSIGISIVGKDMSSNPTTSSSPERESEMNIQQIRAKLQGVFHRNAEEAGSTSGGTSQKSEAKVEKSDEKAQKSEKNETSKPIDWKRVGKIALATVAGVGAIGGSYYAGHRMGSKGRSQTETLMSGSTTL